MARYMRTDLGPNNARLRPPAVVGPGIYFRGIQIYYQQAIKRLADGQQRREPYSRLKPPTVVTPAPTQIFFGPKINLNVMLPERERSTVTRRRPGYGLSPPAILASNGPSQYILTYSRRGRPKSFLRPPVILQSNLPTQVTLAPSRRPVAKSRLFAPAVIGAGIAWHGPGVYLTRSKQPPAVHSFLPRFIPAAAVQVYYGPAIHLTRGRAGKPKSRLSPPTILQTNLRTQVTFVRVRPRKTLSVLRPPTDTIGLEDQGQLGITLAPQRRGRPLSEIRPPQVVFLAVEIYGPVVQLAHIKVPLANSRLSPPADITEAEEFPVPQIHRTYSRRGQPRSFLRSPAILQSNLPTATTFAPQRRGVAKSRLSPPAVVATVAQVYYGPAVHLTRIRPPRVRSTYVYPLVVLQTQALGYLAVQLVVRPRPKTFSRLSPPPPGQVAVQIYYGPTVHLTRGRAGKPKSALRPPVVLASNLRTATTLAPQRRGRAKSRLAPPTVVFLAVEIYGPTVWRAYSRRGQPRFFLRPPAILASNLPTVTTFAPQRRGLPKSALRPPAVVFLAVEIYGPVVGLARITPPSTMARLQPPAVVTQPSVFYGPVVHLARIRPQPTIASLRPFAERAFEISLGPEAHLAYSRRGRPLFRLVAPAVVGQIVYFGPSTSLAPSFRGSPRSHLLPPTVVDQPPAFLPAERFSFSPQSRGIPKFRLSPPAVVGAGKVNPALRRYLVARKSRLVARKTSSSLRPPVIQAPEIFFGPSTQLALQRRGKPKSFLRPFVLFRSAGSVQITLAPQKRGQPKSLLRPPALVRLAVEIYGPAVELSYSKRGHPRSFLEPPAVVGQRPFRGILTHLAYSRRGQPKSHLTFSAGRIAYPGPRFTLTYSRRGIPKSVLQAAAVIGAGVAFYGPQVHLVRIRPPKVIHALRLTLVAFRRPQGDVCGFDIAASFVCELQISGSKVVGADAPVHRVSGASSTRNTISGSESAGGSVSGSDRKAT